MEKQPNVIPAPMRRIHVARITLWQGEDVLVQTDLRLPRKERFYRLPGGRVDPGEQPFDAAARECEEEIVRPISLGSLLYVTDLQFERKGRWIQELGFVYRAEFRDGLADPIPTSKEPHLQLEWLPRDRMDLVRAKPPSLFHRLFVDGPTGPIQPVLILEDVPYLSLDVQATEPAVANEPLTEIR